MTLDSFLSYFLSCFLRQALSWNLKLASWARLAGQCTCLYSSMLGLEAHAAMPGSYKGAKGLNLAPLAFTANTLTH